MANLRKLTVSGIKWSSVAQVGRQVTQLLTMVLLARLLSPTDFGLLGMALTIIVFIGIFKDLGASSIIIQKPELTSSFLSSIFWINVALNVSIVVALYYCAPLSSLFYHDDRIVPVLRALAFTFPVTNFSALQQAILERNMNFRAVVKAELVSIVCGSVASIGLALFGAGVWSLVCQTLITEVVLAILLWSSSSWRPGFTFHLREVMSVGAYISNLVGYNLLNYLERNADYLIIGYYLGATELGYYTVAYNILLFPLRNISSITTRVMFPVYSKIQNDNQRFSMAYLKIASAIALLSFPMMFGITPLATPLVLSVLGEKWRPVIPLVLIFAPIGLVQSISSANSLIFMSKGRADWLFRWTLVTASITVISFPIGVHWGINGVAVAYAIANAIFLYPDFAIPFHLIDLKFAELINALKWPFINSSVMFIVVIVCKGLLPATFSNIIVLVLYVFLGIIVYGAVSWITNREQLKEIWALSGLNRIKLDDAG